ncbi:SDR family NAD(P)-dependent oxidoreductase [Saccharopolyspora phatthalungensis]|uniref:Acyl transferase domain-containing protein/alpha-beta hydrolase superfamily lysophospholipase/acyl carrier protein n=1 Tax=Saccharopolyspora phatthalungensis TaxID=664693 RepID=A0A840QGX7_9PSEU|nr:SDR family NAD(P)-dependent oxidoreductase [Saccharopolyspora phatthalungensis]MBB5156453.1 acyl transferase domain-containing protein/alpha-beta hydrolase superfamily lysophospholipase/acyl carrier protein [Saccharopolyspora phatthalungensis]
MAIVGIGCRFPGGITDPRSFWDLIVSGVDAVGDIPPDRWRADDFFDADPATPSRMFVRQGGFLRSPVDEFDAGFFGMSPREAAALDPQQRLLLEVTWEAFEDAGIPPSSTAAASVGSYIGGFTFDAATLQLNDSNRHLVGAATPTGVSMTMLAARLSYTFDWSGPCLTLDTACSSSLVAFHQACAAIARGECDLAVAGGVNVMVNPVTSILMSKGQFLSPDARCKSFDHRANGYARGEGAGILLLKPLSAAERDGDHIYAVVRGTAVNQDGRTPGVTVPSVAAQRALIRRACWVGGVEPASVGYYEAHGTGTAVGDPIEATAIGEALGDSDRTHWIGSVKSNFGHTEAAAGAAGVIKASLCLENGLIPPNLHFERPNPGIPFDRLPLRVPTEMVQFPEQDGPRRAGVNSFGFGGTNAHAILEQGPTVQASGDDEEDDGRAQLLPLSARSPEALRALVDAYATLLEQPEAPALREVCRAAARQRDHHPLRAFVVAADPAEAAGTLRELDIAPRRAARPEIAFVYTGMGPQWWGMGRELLREEPRFAEVVAECDEFLARFGLSIGDELRRDEAESRLTSTLYAQVANFVVQAGLTALWRDWGIEPATIVGHSVGEVAAAYAAGVYSLEDALTVSFHRASLQSRLAGRGAMAAVGLPADEVAAYLVDGVDVAAVNSATATTLAGDREALEVVAERLTAAGASVKQLRVEVAYHSHQMDEIREPLLAALREIRPRPAQIPLFSTVTGDRVDGPEFDAEYWWRNVRQQVRFADAFRRLLAHAPGAVLEVGPHPVLASAIDEALADRGADTVRLASLRRDRPQRQQLLESLGSLYAAGAEPDWKGVHPGPRKHLDLPRYPWQRERHWVESTESRNKRLGTEGPRLSGRAVASVTPIRDVELSASKFPYLIDHRIGEAVIFPGSGYLEVALAMFADDDPCYLEDVVFHRPLVLPASSITTMRAGYDPSRRLVTLHSSAQSDESAWTLHAELRRGHVARPRIPERRTETLAELTRTLPELSHDDVYARLDGSNLNYGPAFRAVERLWCREETGEVFGELRLDTVELDGYRLHPAILDGALQAMIAGAVLIGGDGAGTYVPARIEALRFFRAPGQRLWVHGRDRRSEVPGRLECDLTLVTDDGEVVAEVSGLRAQRLAEDGGAATGRSTNLRYEHVWQPEPLERTGDVEGTWILVGSSVAAVDLERGLNELGGKVVRTEPAEDGWPARVAAAVAGDSECRGVVYLNDPTIDRAAACTPVAEPLRLVQALPVTAVPLFVVTTGAQSVSADDATTDPSAAALWGFGRVVSAERPELRCRLIDLDSAVPEVDDRLLDALITEFTHDGLDEVALRTDGRYVRRLERAGEGSSLDHLDVRTDETPVRLRPRRAHGDDPRFEATARRAPGPTEVEIEVAHVGLNFKDVLKQTGLLAPQAIEGSHSQQTLGLECSGTIVRVGEAVSDLRPGDEVFAHSRDLFASHVTLDAVRAVKKPAALSLAEAASLLPVVTAHLSLVRLAGVRSGDRVLIHSAAGGVGLAAVRIAKWLGAEVYATAGSEQRREFLRSEGVAHVADSRSTAFAEDILRWTGGEGVDVILNSLPGEMIHDSLRLLRTFGRFVELGKPGSVADHAVRLASAQQAMSFHSFDYDQMMALEPEHVRSCMREVADLYERGAIAPLPVAEVSAGEVDAAFRAMSKPGHLGKIAVHLAREQVKVPASSLSGSPVRPDATYVLTGGLGGLGLTVARWLADRGARHLVLVGRRGIATAEAERVITELTGEGVEVRVEKADVADGDQVAALLTRVRGQLPPIAGIVHGAADFDDVVLSDTDAVRLVGATRPKADGAWNLHLHTQADTLDFFVLFSSVAAQLGAAGAGAYATANEFLNALARYRNAQGLPATAVGWGMIDDVGVAVSRDGHVGSVLRRNGHVGMPPARLVAELETLLRTRPVEASVADIDWPRWARANSQLAPQSRFRNLVPAGTADGSGDESLPRRLREASPAERAKLLPAAITPLLQRTTGLTDSQLDEEQAVDIDSLTAVELRVLLQKELGVAVPAVKLQRNLNVTGLAELLGDELDRAPAETLGLTESLTVHEVVSADGLTIYGHLSVPAGPGPHPAVVVCTAGEGGALDAEGDYVHVSEHAPLHAAGFAVFTVDQRGAPGHGPEFSAMAEMGGGDVDDVIAAAGYLAELPEIDAARISILGTSRGAYDALLALEREPAWWHRAVLLMGMYDPALLVAAERAQPGTLLPHRSGISPSEIEAYFAAPERQPLTSLGDLAAPLLIVHGDADEVVPVAQAHDLAARMRQLDLPAQLVTVPGLAHDSEHGGESWGDLWPQIADFLAEEPK